MPEIVTTKTPHRNGDEEAMRDVWSGIREAQDKAACALQKIAIHEQKCDGRQRVIELQLRIIVWLLTGLAGVGSTVLTAFVLQSLSKTVK